jgi:hypothetical protein
MFSGQNIKRTNNLVILETTDLFKQPEFYNRDSKEQQQILNNLDQDVIYGCHRQHQFDFRSNKVISIELDFIDFLPKRIQAIHIDQMKEILLASKFEKLNHTDKIKFEYKIWSKNNIFSTDAKLPISLVFDSKGMQEFCLEHNFLFDQTLLEDIVNDMQTYI